ncbi:retrovirus-related pol polyprotein from transposon TNT 1-94 [Tanacetum coccineum]
MSAMLSSVTTFSMYMFPFGNCPEGNGDVSSVYGCLKGDSGNSREKRLAISMVKEAWLSEKEEDPSIYGGAKFEQGSFSHYVEDDVEIRLNDEIDYRLNNNHLHIQNPLTITDFQDSPDDEEDTRSSQEYLNDLEEEYQARALLDKSKRFFKKGTQRLSSAKATDQTECHKCVQVLQLPKPKWLRTKVLSLKPMNRMKKCHQMVKVKVLMALAEDNDVVSKKHARNSEWVKISMRKHVNTDILKENKNLRTELKELAKITKTWLNSSNKVNYYVSEQIPTQKNIMGVDQLTKDPSSSGQKDLVCEKSLANNKKVSIPGVEKPLLSKSKGFIMPNHDTGRILLAKSQRNTTDPPVAVTNSSENAYDSANESLVYSTPVPSLKKLDAPAKGNKSTSALNVNSAPAGKLKNVKIKYDLPLAIIIKELKKLKLQISKTQSSHSRIVLETEVSSDQNGQADQNDQPAQADEILNDDHSRLQSARRHRQDETFAPVARLEAIRISLSFATYMNFIVYQMDIRSAFLNGKLKEEVYVKQPLGLESSEFPNHVCKLDKAIYGLKQAPRAWYETLLAYLTEHKFVRGYSDSDYPGYNMDIRSTSDTFAAGCCANILWITSQLIDYDIIYEKRSYSQRDIELHLIPTQYQLADIFTKSLDEPTIKRLIVELGMLNIDSKPKPLVQTEEKLRFSNFMQN